LSGPGAAVIAMEAARNRRKLGMSQRIRRS
jgi:hypothetical protein